MSITQWWRIDCPGCDAVNWIDNGDPQDMSMCDMTDFKCWKCAKAYRISEDCEEIEDEDEAEYVPTADKTPR